LAVDLLLSVFEFASTPFIELRESIWLSVFEEAAAIPLPALISRSIRKIPYSRVS